LLDVGDDLLDGLGQPDAALGVGGKLLELALAAAAGMDLALHYIERAGQLLRRRFRLAGVKQRHAVGDRRAIGLQELLALIFMDVHRGPSLFLGEITSWPGSARSSRRSRRASAPPRPTSRTSSARPC